MKEQLKKVMSLNNTNIEVIQALITKTKEIMNSERPTKD